MNTKFILKSIVTILTISYCHLTMANSNTSQTNADQPRKPPPEAITACEGKSAGDKVSFTTPRGNTIEATCTMMQEGLAARPTHPRKGGKAEHNKPE